MFINIYILINCLNWIYFFTGLFHELEFFYYHRALVDFDFLIWDLGTRHPSSKFNSSTKTTSLCNIHSTIFIPPSLPKVIIIPQNLVAGVNTQCKLLILTKYFIKGQENWIEFWHWNWLPNLETQADSWVPKEPLV